MQIEVTTRGDGIPDKAKEYAREKLSRVARFFDRVGRVQVSLERGKDQSKAHAVAHLDTGSTVVADTVHGELRGAIDLLSEKLQRQVRREKERLIGRNRKGAPNGSERFDHETEPSFDEAIQEKLDEE